MAMFRKTNKKKGNDAADVVVESVVSQDTGSENAGKKSKNGGKKKPAELMSSVINESVVETVIEEGFVGNDFLKYGDAYIGLFLEVSEIEGLNAKVAKRDEDKSQIIEAINSGRMKCLVTSDLMAMEALVFIPDAITLDAMGEYSLLSSRDYKIALVEGSGDLTVKAETIPFAKAVECLEKGASFAQFLDGEAAFEETVSETKAAPDESADSAFGEDSGFDGGEVTLEEDMPFDTGSVSEEPLPYDDSEQNWSGAPEEASFEEGELVFDDDMAVEQEVEEEEEISHDDFEKAMTRKLYSDDLNLVISTEAFDAQFMHGNSFVPFAEDRGEGWLNQYLGQMSKDANADLRRVHQDNLLKMRTLFFNMVSTYVSDISKELDYTDMKTEYGKQYSAIMQVKAESEDSLDYRISDRRAELADEWERRLADVGQAAATAAASQYRDRHEKQHNDAMYRVEQELRSQVQDSFNDNVREMNDKRREEAAKRLDLGITSALAEVSRTYMALLEEENEKYAQYQKSMMDFIDANRKDEIARAKALDEENRQREAADAVMAECTAKMQRQTEEFDARRLALSTELEDMKRRHAAELKAKETEYIEGLRKATADHETLQARVDKLTGDLCDLDAKKEEQYQSRIDALVAEREAFSQKYDHLVDMVKKNNAMLITVSVVGVVAALVVGFVAGEFVNIKGKSLQNQKQISQQMEQDMKDIDFNLPEGYEGHVSDDGVVTITQVGLDESLDTQVSE